MKYSLDIELPYVAPLDWNALISFFKRHEIKGVEVIEKNTYSRHMKIPGGTLYYKLSYSENPDHVLAEIKISDLSELSSAVKQIRTQFDLSHNPHNIEFGKKNQRYELIEDIKGMRVHGAMDPFEVAISIILQQLVSTEQAKNICDRLVEMYGEKFSNPVDQRLTHFFPTPEILKDADFEGLGITKTRGEAIRQLSRMVYDNELDLSGPCEIEATKAKLLSVKGMGPWTVEMIAMRCLKDTNGYPSKDLIIHRAVEKFKLKEDFLSPWRAYLVMALWKTQAHVLTSKKKAA